jgi:hypothetical protein
MEGEENAAGKDNEWVRIVNAWVLGEVLLSTSFKDAVVDAFIHKFASGIHHSTGFYSAAYRYSSKGSAIRKLLLDIAVHHWCETSPSRVYVDSDPAILAPFFRDICTALLKEKCQPASAGNPSDSIRQDSCFCHEHGDKPCYKTMF